jgi:hypothetical protein
MQIEHNGRSQSATAWAREIGVTYHVLRWRLQHWSKDQALTTPKRTKCEQDLDGSAGLKAGGEISLGR